MVIADIAIGIITAPREINTLSYSVRSLRKFVNNRLYIFCEPGRLEVEGSDILINVNAEKKGALHNYDHALRWMLKNTDKPFIWVTEDDYVYNSDIIVCLNEAVNDSHFGYYNLFTNYWCPSLPNPMAEGWTDLQLGYYKAWGVSYLFPRAVVEKLINHETYVKYLATTTKHIDGAVSETLLQMGLPMYYHNPSSSCSCAVVSTLGHNHKTDGLHFNISK